jgi:hypothetical protein
MKLVARLLPLAIVLALVPLGAGTAFAEGYYEFSTENFRCYNVTGASVKQSVVLDDQFESQDTTVLRPVMICTPVNVSPPPCDSGWCEEWATRNTLAHLVCYRTQKEFPVPGENEPDFHGAKIVVSNGFGTDDLNATLRSNILCVPSFKCAVGENCPGDQVPGT